jgi:hypothetical protein
MTLRQPEHALLSAYEVSMLRCDRPDNAPAGEQKRRNALICMGYCAAEQFYIMDLINFLPHLAS